MCYRRHNGCCDTLRKPAKLHPAATGCLTNGWFILAVGFESHCRGEESLVPCLIYLDSISDLKRRYRQTAKQYTCFLRHEISSAKSTIKAAVSARCCQGDTWPSQGTASRRRTSSL